MVVSQAQGGSLSRLEAITVGTMPKALDVASGLLLIGGANGSIYECVLGQGAAPQELLASHNQGEVWGLAQDGQCVYTSGDDN